MTNEMLDLETLFTIFKSNEQFKASSYAIKRKVTDEVYIYFSTHEDVNIRDIWLGDWNQHTNNRAKLQDTFIYSENQEVANYWMFHVAAVLTNDKDIALVINSECEDAIVNLAFYNESISNQDLLELLHFESDRISYAAFRNLKNRGCDEELLNYATLLGIDSQPL